MEKFGKTTPEIGPEEIKPNVETGAKVGRTRRESRKKVDVGEIRAALEANDPEALDKLSGSSFEEIFRKIPSGPDQVDMEDRGQKSQREAKKKKAKVETSGEKQEGQAEEMQEDLITPTPILKEESKKEKVEKTSKKREGQGEQEKGKQKEKKELTPFIAALQAATKITTRWPKKEQPEELRLFYMAIEKLNKDERRNLVFNLAKNVLEDKAPIQALFLVAQEANMMTIAHNTAVIKKIIQEEKISFSDLQEIGLAKIKPGKGNKRLDTVYYLGNQSLANAAENLKKKRKFVAAKMLENHLAVSARFAKDTKKTKKPASDK